VLTSNNSMIFRLPAEILILIFTYLPNLSDVISLAAASRHLRLIYTENAKPIYDMVASRTFPFHGRARQLLVDGGGPELEEGLSLFYVATMFRNWKIVKAAMAEFELQMKREMKSKQSYHDMLWCLIFSQAGQCSHTTIYLANHILHTSVNRRGAASCGHIILFGH
jgi:F-box-like